MQDTLTPPSPAAAASVDGGRANQLAVTLGILILTGLLLWAGDTWTRALGLGLGTIALFLAWQLTQQSAAGTSALRHRFSGADALQVDLSPPAGPEQSDPDFVAFSDRLRDMLLGLGSEEGRVGDQGGALGASAAA